MYLGPPNAKELEALGRQILPYHTQFTLECTRLALAPDGTVTCFIAYQTELEEPFDAPDVYSVKIPL